MKYFCTLFVAIACFVLTGFGQVVQTFEKVTNLNRLSDSCWQFLGATLHTTSSGGAKALAVNAASVGGKAWVYTPYTNLTISSNISFAFQLPGRLSAGASRTLSVRLMNLDGTSVTLGTITLDEYSLTTPYTFAVRSTISGTRKIVIEVSAVGNETLAVILDNILIDGSFNYNPPDWCRDKSNGTTSIHYLKVFQGLLVSDRVHLQWTVGENENNQYFEIERSFDGKDFQGTAIVKATGRVAEEAYSYFEPLQGNAYYRLKLVSKTGIRMYSNVLYFKNEAALPAVALLQNPVQQTLKVGFTAERKQTAHVTVFDMSGFKVFEKDYQAGKGYNVIIAELNANLKKGLYFVEVMREEKKSTTRFIKE